MSHKERSDSKDKAKAVSHPTMNECEQQVEVDEAERCSNNNNTLSGTNVGPLYKLTGKKLPIILESFAPPITNTTAATNELEERISHRPQSSPQHQQRGRTPTAKRRRLAVMKVVKRLGEGGHAYVYLVRESSKTSNSKDASGVGAAGTRNAMDHKKLLKKSNSFINNKKLHPRQQESSRSVFTKSDYNNDDINTISSSPSPNKNIFSPSASTTAASFSFSSSIAVQTHESKKKYSPSKKLLKNALPSPFRSSSKKQRNALPHHFVNSKTATTNNNNRHLNPHVLKVSYVDTKERIEQSIKEANMLRLFSSHPNIVTFISSGFFGEAVDDDKDDDELEDGEENGNELNMHLHEQFMNNQQRSAIKTRRRKTSLHYEKNNVHWLLVDYCPGGTLLDLLVMLRAAAASSSSLRNKKNSNNNNENSLSKKLQQQQDKLYNTNPNEQVRHVGGGVSSTNTKGLHKKSPMKKILQSNSNIKNGIVDESSIRLDLQDIVAIFLQVASALSFLHNYHHNCGLILNNHEERESGRCENNSTTSIDHQLLGKNDNDSNNLSGVPTTTGVDASVISPPIIIPSRCSDVIVKDVEAEKGEGIDKVYDNSRSNNNQCSERATSCDNNAISSHSRSSSLLSNMEQKMNFNGVVDIGPSETKSTVSTATTTTSSSPLASPSIVSPSTSNSSSSPSTLTNDRKATNASVPIIHFDIKPENILFVHPPTFPSNGGNYQERWRCKLCDFGSAHVGHMSLRSSTERNTAQEVIKRTTTQMYRSPEMVDLYLEDTITEKADVWALGCSIYNVIFMKNCFDENSNLAILAGKYDIPSPEEHGYSPTLIELVQRILTVRSKDRPDIEDVIDCLHALQLDMELPPSRSRDATLSCEMDKDNKAGSTSQPPQSGPLEAPYEQARKSTSFTAQVQKNVTAKPLAPDSVAAKRLAERFEAIRVDDEDFELADPAPFSHTAPVTTVAESGWATFFGSCGSDEIFEFHGGCAAPNATKVSQLDTYNDLLLEVETGKGNSVLVNTNVNQRNEGSLREQPFNDKSSFSELHESCIDKVNSSDGFMEVHGHHRLEEKFEITVPYSAEKVEPIPGHRHITNYFLPMGADNQELNLLSCSSTSSPKSSDGKCIVLSSHNSIEVHINKPEFEKCRD